jgi:hypothetical protein
MQNEKYINGSCLCGAVEFSAALPSKWCAHCHCSLCRKAHGAGYVTWVGFEAGQVSFTRGEDQLSWYESSPGAQRGFCQQCGSSLFFRSENWAGELHIALACINDPIDRQPQANVFFDSHVDWMPIDTRLKQIDG